VAATPTTVDRGARVSSSASVFVFVCICVCEFQFELHVHASFMLSTGSTLMSLSSSVVRRWPLWL
jgi:hypothetical protein